MKRSLSEIVSDIDLNIPMPTGGWHHMDDVPRDGTPIVVKVEHSFRWAPYVDEHRASSSNPCIIQRIEGKLGRWQVLDSKNNWVNCEPPEGVWRL